MNSPKQAIESGCSDADLLVSQQRLAKRLRQFFAGPQALHDVESRQEQGQAQVRVVNGLIVVAYLAIVTFADPGISYRDWAMPLGAFIVFSVLMLVATRRASAPSIGRRVLGNAGDVVAISYVMVATGSVGIPLFVLFLSITFGNGFRFGVRAMALSMLLCLAGFLAVVGLSPVWQQLPVTVPIAIAIALVLLPGYAAHLIHQLATATKRAEEASAAKSRFLARMSHELRTPLNGILGSAELLGASRRSTHEDRSLLNLIKESVQVSIRQIDNVLDYSKIEAGKLTLEHIPFDLHELLNGATRLVRSNAIEKKLRLTLHVDPAIPHRLIGDPHHLKEVLLNLLSNAVKFTQVGYVALEARLVASSAESVRVELAVHDTGIGIEASALARIFEAFAQEDTGTTRRYGGTGLGTTIAKQLTELMGGSLRVDSVKGQGSAFYATIPFARASIGEDECASYLRGMRALLITKNSVLEERAQRVLCAGGATCKVVRSPGEAIAVLRHGARQGSSVNVVLADAVLVLTPAGEHCAEDLTERAALTGTPVLLFCDRAPLPKQLREWGYTSALAYDLTDPAFHAALRIAKPVRPEADAPQVARVEPWVWRETPPRRPRLLIADDNPVNLMVLKRVLEAANFAVDTAEDGRQALELLRSNRYKVAVLDMHMPGLDGTDVIKQYRLTQKGPRTFIIVLTANATLEAKIESAEAGADFYLSKPVPAEQLLSAVENAFQDVEVYDISRLRRKALTPLDDMPVLNADVIGEMGRIFNEPSRVGELVQTFETESGRLMEGLKNRLARRNADGFWEDMHALKSMCLTVGALRLARACSEIESQGFPGAGDEAEQVLSRLKDIMRETVTALRSLMGSNAVAARPDSSAKPSS